MTRSTLRRRELILAGLGLPLAACGGPKPPSIEADEPPDGPALHAAFVASHCDGWGSPDDVPRITRIDAKRGRVVAHVDLVDRVGELALASGSLWGGGVETSRLLRIDPTTLATTGEVAVARTAALAAARGVLFAADVVTRPATGWTRTGDSTLHRIDAARATVLRSQPLPGVVIGKLAVGKGTLWAQTDPMAPPHVLFEIDAATLRVRRRHAVADVLPLISFAPAHVVFGGGAAWFGACRLGDWALFTLRPGDAAPRRVPVDFSRVAAYEHKMMRIAFARGRLLSTGEKHDPTLLIDPTTGGVTAVAGLPFGTERPQPLAVTVDGVWLAASDHGRVFLVDPASRRMKCAVEVPAPVAIVAA